MTNWLEKNKKTLIRLAFLVPIVSVAIISISHVVGWYDLANPASWAVYLSVAVEIAAMSAIAAASVRIKGFSVWLVFSIVTLIQLIGNVYFSYVEIDVNSQGFKDWMDLIAPITSAMGSSAEDGIAQRRFLAILEGGLLPLISLTCLHFFIGYGENKDPQETVDATSETTQPEPKVKEEIVVDESKEADTTSNIEPTPQIDSIERTVESESDEQPTDLLDKMPQSVETLKPQVGQLSTKMKKILGR